MPLTPSSTRAAPLAGTAAALVALVVAPLLAFNLPPSSTVLNQAASFVGFGLWLAWAVGASPAGSTAGVNRYGAGASRQGTLALEAALALAILAALGAHFVAALPWSLALAPIAAVAAAGLVAFTAAWLAREERGAVATFRDFALGMVVACVLSSAVGLVQVFAPAWADGDVISPTYIDGRAVGNMRQPNHLSSLLLWGTVAAVWLGEARVVRKAASTALALLFLFVVVLTASRTGAVSMLLLLGWGALDKRLSRPARRLLVLAPLIYFAFWYATGVWADHTHHVFGGETRFSTQGDVSSSRIGIWSNTLALIRLHPWFGVGWGNFNFAWTLTPFPHRPVAFFDHTHNLVLQLLVELGIPLGASVCAALAWALWRAWQAARRAVRAEAPAGAAVLRAAAFMMVVLILVHSLLEYPLWYAYYLLPAAFAFGVALSRGGSDTLRRPADAATGVAPALASRAVPAPPRTRRLLFIGTALLALGGLASAADYARVVAIFAPGPWDTRSLPARIADGRRSVFFAHHADYAAATNAEHPAETMQSFATASHYLLDARLLQAWAVALDAAGDTDRARYLAQRLREFHNDQSAAFFEPCELPPAPDEALPFQCEAPHRAYRYEDFE